MKPNILFVLIDSLRADRFYGETKNAKTPNLEKLMNNGAYFKQAIGCSDYTGPSIQAIFTSRFPFGCGLTKEHYQKVFSDNSNSVEFLKKNGYKCYAIMEGALCTQGIHKPFDDYVSFEPSENIHNGIAEKTLEKFDSFRNEEPWFYYVHFMDLHKPCRVPSDFSHLKESERYDFNITSIDACIGKLLEKIDLKNTLVIATADHGEFINPLDDTKKEEDGLKKSLKSVIKKIIPKSLKQPIHEKKRSIIEKRQVSKMTEHEKRGIRTRPMVERTFFDDVVRVPLLFGGYGFNGKNIIEEQVRNIDIFPTILEIIGLPQTQGPINGQSLSPLIKGEDFKIKPAYMESSILKTATKNARAVVGVRTEQFKYFRDINDQNKNVHLYDLVNDPFEENNLAESDKEKLLHMEKIMQEIKETAIPQDKQEELSKEEETELEAELKKLGYL